MMNDDEKYDHLVDMCFGSQMSLHFMTKENVEDIINRGVREDLDVELIADCDNREDFLQLRSLERTIENFERGEYL